MERGYLKQVNDCTISIKRLTQGNVYKYPASNYFYRPNGFDIILGGYCVHTLKKSSISNSKCAKNTLIIIHANYAL